MYKYLLYVASVIEGFEYMIRIYSSSDQLPETKVLRNVCIFTVMFCLTAVSEGNILQFKHSFF